MAKTTQFDSKFRIVARKRYARSTSAKDITYLYCGLPEFKLTDKSRWGSSGLRSLRQGWCGEGVVHLPTVGLHWRWSLGRGCAPSLGKYFINFLVKNAGFMHFYCEQDATLSLR